MDSFLESIAGAIANLAVALATTWLYLPEPSLRGAASTVDGGVLPAEFAVLANWFLWVGLAVGVLALLAVGARLVVSWRSGDGGAGIGRVTWVLVGVGMMGVAASVVGMVLQDPYSIEANESIAFIQASVFPFTAAMVFVSVVIAGMKTAWTQRGNDVAAIAGQLLRVLVVSSGTVLIVQFAIDGFDGFTRWVLGAATECDINVDGDGACFAGKIQLMMLGGVESGAAAQPTVLALTGTLGPLLGLIIFLVASLAMLMQLVILIGRTVVLTLMVGLLPLASSFTITDMGKSWFGKSIGWLLAALLYKPVAALILAVAIRMVGVWNEDPVMMIMQTVTGIAMMVLTVIAMPTLMRLCVPAVSQVAASAGASMAAVSAVMSTGIIGGQMAASAFKSMPSGSGGGGADGAVPTSGGGATGSAGASGSAGGAGSTGGSGSSAPAGASGASGAPGATGSTGAAGSSGLSAGAASGSAGAAGGGATAGGGIAAGAGGGAAAGGAAAGAAGGPMGMAAMAASEKVGEIAAIPGQMTSIAAESATGDGAAEK